MPLLKLWAGSLVMLAAVSLPLQAASPVKVGSKIDTEGALLGNIILQVLESHGVPTVNKVQLGTTPVVRGAITSGELDIGNDSNLLIVFYVQIMPDDLVMQLHRF